MPVRLIFSSEARIRCAFLHADAPHFQRLGSGTPKHGRAYRQARLDVPPPAGGGMGKQRRSKTGQKPSGPCPFALKFVHLRHKSQVASIGVHAGVARVLRPRALSGSVADGGQLGVRMSGQCLGLAVPPGGRHGGCPAGLPHVLPPALHQDGGQGVHPPHVGQPDTSCITLLHK